MQQLSNSTANILHSDIQTKTDRIPLKTALSPLACAVQVAIVGLGLAHGASQAATIEVTSNTDVKLNTSTARANICTLRDAIASVNLGNVIAYTGCTNTGDPFGTNDSITFANSLPSNTITLGNSNEFFDFHLPIAPNRTVSIDASMIPGRITVNAGSRSRVFTVDSATLSINNMTITGGSHFLDHRSDKRDGGGGIYATGYASVYLNNCIVSGNSVSGRYRGNGNGGGIFVKSGSSIELNNCTVSGNSASEAGGGIFAESGARVSLNNSTVSENSAGYYGGGIFAKSGARMRLNNSTVSKNSSSWFSGGIRATHRANVNLNNSTVSGNSALMGGGISVANSATISLSNSTVSGNSAILNGGIAAGSGRNSRPHVELINSIIGDNISNDGFDCRGSKNVFSDTVSIIERGCDTSAARAIDPGLQALTDNGGSTQTHALRANSAARNSGAGCDATDQRGQPRNDGACDVGAFEFINGHD